MSDLHPLELTTYSCQRDPQYAKDFGMVRISEILGGDTAWRRESITFDSFCHGEPFTHVVNSQMIVDVDVAPRRGEKTLAVISRPVMQRLLDGRTKGFAILPLGAIQASFFAGGDSSIHPGAVLHFDLENARR